MNLGAKVVKHRHIIFIVSLLLLIPSLIGYKVTRINYDMLTYLPSTMDTMKGQNVLMKEFGKGGFSIVVLENMKSDDVTQLKADYSRINGVEEVLNLEDVLDPTVPKSMLPDQVAQNLSNKEMVNKIKDYADIADVAYAFFEYIDENEIWSFSDKFCN